ncbi:MAG: hypothetical protein Q7T33_05930 [Dehalococcoidia bacterium]|nr:hypothetical protein [Dehalococcoidia bacterium]
MHRTNVLTAIRLTALAATASVLVLVMACGGGEDKDTTATPAAATPTEAAAAGTPAATATPAAAAGLPILAAIPNAPTRAPRPTLAPGVTAAPTPAPPPDVVREVFFYVDTVTAGAGESKFNVDADRYCTQSSSFRRGMHIVWRVIASDNTGKELHATDVATAVLKVPGAEDVTFKFGLHGGATGAWFWTAAWDVPPDYPLGAVDFTVEFTTNDGKSGAFKQIPVSNAASKIESRLQIVG